MRPNLDLGELRKLLVERKIHCLRHANAIETSLSFIHIGALISRQKAIAKGIPQTDQLSDEIDARDGILDDLFLNLPDHHVVYRSPNPYGPVLFQVSTRLLLDLIQGTPGAAINITRKNPIYWTGRETDADRWFLSVQEFETEKFVHPRNHQAAYQLKGAIPDVVISGLPGIPMSCVQRIKIDTNPELPRLFSDFKYVASKVGNPDVVAKIEERLNCPPTCKCRNLDFVWKTHILRKFTFGGWKTTLGKSDYEDWIRKHGA